MKKNIKWIICIVSMLIFIVLSVLVVTKKDIYLDLSVYNFVSKYISENLTNIVKYLTSIGGAAVVILITIFMFLKNKKYGIFLGLNLILITIFQFVLKTIFARSRPVGINLIDESGYSFPSGHSLTSMAFYGFIIYIIHISNLSKKIKSILISIFSLFILIVGFSRIYLGVHFFTDVLGGFSFSLSYLIIYISIIKEKLK